MNSTTWLMIAREYKQIVRRKSFLIGTLLTPLLFGALIFLPRWLMDKKNTTTSVAITDASGFVLEPLQASLEALKLDNGKPRYEVEVLKVGDEKAAEAAIKRVADGKLRAYLSIPEDVVETNQVELRMKSVTEFIIQGEVGDSVSSVLREKRLTTAGLETAAVAALMRPVKLEVRGAADEQQKDRGAVVMVSFIVVFLLYITLLSYGIWIMNAVIEDKSSRVYEVMLSATTAREILLGKILGVGLSALTQYAIWATVFLATKSVRPIPQLEGIDIGIGFILPLIVIFLLGFSLYALLYAALGSLCSSTQDAQQVQWPLMSFLIAPMVLMSPILFAPDGMLARVLSMFPMTSPIIMPLRLGATDPGPVQLGACIALLVAAIVIAYIISGKIFRIAIMMHGKRPEWKTVIRWLREAEN